jgi:predicted nucleic acid-binding protein
MIAAMARTRAATVATRNVADFRGLAVELVNPWAF